MSELEPEFVSLFAGVGGFDLGFEQAGLKCAAQVEIDRSSRFVLNRHWPGVPKIEDVRKAGADNLPRVPVICGGFPCQDLSVAGSRSGFLGSRSSLFFEMVRITDELRPDFLIWENVPGLLSSRGGADFWRVLYELDTIGYCGAWTMLDAQFFGLAQRRRRIFGVFARSDIGAKRCAEILALADRLRWNPTQSDAERQKVAATLGRGSGQRGWAEDLDRCGALPPAIALSNRGHADEISETLRSDSHGALPRVFQEQGGFGLRTFDNIAPTLLREGGTHQGGASYLPVVAMSPRRSQIESGDKAPTLNTGGGGHGMPAVAQLAPTLGANSYSPSKSNRGSQVDFVIGQSQGVRRLTPVECERLQGFPIQEKCVIIEVCLDHQNASANVEIQSLRSQKPAGLAERTGLLSAVRYAESSLSPSNPGGNKPVQNTVLINCAENGVEILSQGKCFLSANFAENRSLFPQFTKNEDFARLVAGLNSIVERITLIGKAELPVNERFSIVHQNGNLLVRLSGKETMQLVNDVIAGSITNKELLKSITSSLFDTKPTEPILITLFSSVLSATSGYIPSEILKNNSFRIEIHSSFGWTFPQSDSVRYRQLGNAVAVPVAKWIGSQLITIQQSAVPA